MQLPPWHKLFTIYPKLIVSFLVVLTPVYVISLMMNDYAENNVRDKIDDLMRSRVHFYIRQLENEFSRVIRMQEEFVNDRDVRMLSRAGELFSDLEWRSAVLNLRGRLVTLRNSSSYAMNASIYLPSEKRLISTAAAYDELSEDEYAALKSASHRVANPFVTYGDRLFLSFPYSSLAMINGREPLFLVSAEIDQAAVGDVLDSLMVDGAGGALVVDRDLAWAVPGNASDPSMTGKMLDWLHQGEGANRSDPKHANNGISLQTVAINGEPYWVYVEHSPQLGFSLLMYMPEADMLGSLAQYRVWFWVLSVISVLVAVLFAYWIFGQIHQPLRRLIRAFRSMESGMMNETLVYRRSDEFGYLYSQFNHTAARIKELIHEVYEQRYRANLSELRQLQSQINPHFLYNNFFILYRMAKDEDNESIARFTSYLGKYFQYITRTKEANIRLQEEVAFSRTYAEIQTFRFEERIGAKFGELPARCADVPVPKLILQPIIENVYEHGLRDTLEGGLLEVRFELNGNRLDIVVEDNGKPMPEADYDELRRKLQAAASIDIETTGLINVHRRLRLEYGAEGGITFERRPGGGNRVVLAIPLAAKNEATGKRQ